MLTLQLKFLQIGQFLLIQLTEVIQSRLGNLPYIFIGILSLGKQADSSKELGFYNPTFR